MKRQTVAACIIARDEERVLERCLRSIRKACDEVCLIDTGSSDRTESIARKAGAKVSRFTRCNDADGRIGNFALARNAALRMATADWVLWIDPDEVLSRASLPSLLTVVRRTGVSCVAVTVTSGSAQWCTPRLFRRLPGVRFRGIVHEWIDTKGDTLTEPLIVIHNMPDKRGKESSVERDLRLCTRALKRSPRDARMLLYLGRALQRAGRYEHAIVTYERYLKHEHWFRSGRLWVMHSIGACHLLNRSWHNALRWAQRTLAIDATRAEAHCVAGDALLALGDRHGAERSYRAALLCPLPARDAVMFVNRDLYRTWPRQRLRSLLQRS